MSSQPPALLCHYRYDPLDRLINHTLPDTPTLQRFYCKSRLATEIKGAVQYSIVQHGDQLLAQQRREGDVFDNALLATDQQRSVLHTLDKNPKPQSIAYSPYGHRPPESGLISLLGFAGERPDPMTGHYLLGNGYRAFNSVLMRFNSQDIVSPFGKGGLNAYAYCLGDPINLYDPNGQSGLTVVVAVARWRLRAKVNVAMRKQLAIEVAKTNSIKVYPHEPPSLLRRGVTPDEAVKARADIHYLNNLDSRLSFWDGKFYDDLSRERRASQHIEKLTGVPVSDRLNVLNYIKRRPGENSRSAFSSERLDNAAKGRFDAQVSRDLLPSRFASANYLAELRSDPRVKLTSLTDAAKRIRSNHFIAQ